MCHPWSQRPLVFVCHSLGGLVVKQALISSAKKTSYESIFRSTKAVFFFGTPHRGARVLDSNKKVKLLESMAMVANYEIPENLRTVLKPRSNELFAINDDFSDIKDNISVVNFYEMKKTEKLGTLVVEQDSAIIHHPGEDNVPLKRTHQELVSYDNAEDDTYMTVVETLVEKLSHILVAPAVDDEEQLKYFISDCVKTLDFAESARRVAEIAIPHLRTFEWLWDLSKACIRYCILPELKSFLLLLRSLAGSKDDLDREFKATSRKKYPFLNYAINYWMQHCEKAETSGAAQTDEILRFEDDGAEKFETWLELYNDCALGPSLAIDTTIFLIAVMFNLQDFVLRRLEQGVDLSSPVQRFGHYLHIAAMHGHKDMIKILLTHGAEVNAVGGEYHTALQAAAYSGSKDAVEVLLDAGGYIGLRGGYYGDPLYAAAYQGHLEIVDLLIEKGAEVADDGGYSRNALRAAAETGRNSVVRTLLNQGADASAYDENGANIFFWAVYSSSESTVKVLIEEGTDIRTRIFPGFTLLHWLSLYGSEETVELLMDKGAEIEETDFNGSTPLHWAASNLHQGVLEMLLSAGSDPKLVNNYGITPLHFAAGQAGVTQVQVLLDAEADLYARDLMGFSVFHYAALNSSADVLCSLLDDELDLDFETKDVVGRRPIHIAAEFGCLASLLLLANRTADLEGRDSDGRTILHAAARHDSEDALLFCLQKGLDVSMDDSANMTALHHVFMKSSRLPRLTYLPKFVDLARRKIQQRGNKSDSKRRRRRRKNSEVKNNEWMVLELSDRETDERLKTAKIDMLLSFGVDVDAQDENGNTALHLASSTGNISAIKLLLSKEGNHRLRDSRGLLPVDMASCEEAREILSAVQFGGRRLTGHF